MPSFAGELAAEVFQTHSVGYRKPADVPQGTVLVVGGGNTGFQIAKELSATHRVYLSVGSRQTPLPQRLLGRDLFWWLGRLGLLHKTVDSRLGRRMREHDALIGSSSRSARKHGVEMKTRAVGASGRTITFADGSALDVDAVIWASGYDLDHSVDRRSSSGRKRPHPPPARSDRTRPDFTSSVSRGSTPGARLCSAGSRTTPNTSPRRSLLFAPEPGAADGKGC